MHDDILLDLNLSTPHMNASDSGLHGTMLNSLVSLDRPLDEIC